MTSDELRDMTVEVGTQHGRVVLFFTMDGERIGPVSMDLDEARGMVNGLGQAIRAKV